nr:P-loop NTPase [Desulfobacterales bacterium]
MIISVASGKGGTGKTTVATNLALAIGKEVQLLDCDVEEPNAHLFIQPVFEHRQTVTTPVPRIDKTACSLCGQCTQLCQYRAIVQIADQVLVFDELC